MGKVSKVLKRLDVFPKTLDDFKEKSFSGGAISIVSILLIISFLILEISEYTSKEIQTELVVDSTRSSKIDVYLDITFPSLPCSFLSLDAVDVAGETQFEISESINKIRLDENGRVMSRDEIARKESESIKEVNTQVVIPKNANNCGTCYGAESDKYPCCETCEDVRNAYKIKGWAFSAINSIAQCKNEGATEKMKVQQNEGCRVFGTFDVEKVAGNFHISPGRSFDSSHAHVHDTAGMDFGAFNLSHTITQLNIGNKSGKQNSIMPTPILNGVSKTTDEPSSLFQYFLKIVPASYDSGNELIESYQYSYTEFYKTISGHDHTGNPGVYFMYDLSPIRVKYYYSSTALPLFITKVLAIIAGIYTLSSIADSFFYYGLPNLLKKLRR